MVNLFEILLSRMFLVLRWRRPADYAGVQESQYQGEDEDVQH